MTVDGEYPKYQILPVEDGSGWCVVIIRRKGGAGEKLYGFVSEAQAQAWVQKMISRLRAPA
jgi:hypothetical protein